MKTWKGGFVFVVLAGLLAVTSLTGCAGEIYVGTRRIDEYQATQSMKPTPWKCLVVDCGGNHGS